MNAQLESLLSAVENGHAITDAETLSLGMVGNTARLMKSARLLRDQGFNNVVTYSRKVFISLTRLCRDVCHYCTFAQVPQTVESPYMGLDEVLEIAREGVAQGCKEALFTLGEKPELRYDAARDALAKSGFESTLHYLAFVAEKVFQETGLLPHLNPGCLTLEELIWLRELSPSMGVMLESASSRLCEKGMPHYGSPDKVPEVRLNTLIAAGRAKVPFTTGILIGIGETRRERIEALLAIRRIHREYHHIQEIIIQNFRAKPGTRMARAPEPDLNELLRTLAIARIVFGAQMSVQAPPNLSSGMLPQLIDAGINDWGGVSPLTPDLVNPEAPWPSVETLKKGTAAAGKFLTERLTVYPMYLRDHKAWIAERFRTPILKAVDGDGFPKVDSWLTGSDARLPREETARIDQPSSGRTESSSVKRIVAKIDSGHTLQEQEIVTLFRARGDDFNLVCQAADALRKALVGDTVTYTVNRNINYTNICYSKCRFCAFSKGKTHEALRGAPYDLTLDEIRRRTLEGWQRGTTEVCIQGGIHPNHTGQHYIDICKTIKQACPEMHIHAFSPLEVWHGAQTLKIDIERFLRQLRDAGLGTLPGTAAEILDDEVRMELCANKITTDQWFEVMRTAHKLGIRTTATIMFGHLDGYRHWARHLLRILTLQKETGGFTEFVPLPFVAMETPIYLKGNARSGPTFRESILMHAVARLVLSPEIKNIQASWVKLGKAGVSLCLKVGANDLGGTLMNENITKAAGANYGQEKSPENIEAIITGTGKMPRQRTTLYTVAPAANRRRSFNAPELMPIINIGP